MSFLKFKNVTKEYESGDTVIKALDNVDFELDKGEFIVILGPSGSGKSTLLNLLGGMDFVTSGEIDVNARKITNMTSQDLTMYRRNEIGFVFQFYNILPNLTAYENVDMAHRLCESRIPAKEAIKAVGLSARADNFPAQLSGGEQQRVSIARALSKNPSIMLCDEPTGALDSVTGKIVLKILKQLVKDYNTTVIVVTHNAAIADIAGTVIKLKDGKIENINKNKRPADIEEVEW